MTQLTTAMLNAEIAMTEAHRTLRESAYSVLSFERNTSGIFADLLVSLAEDLWPSLRPLTVTEQQLLNRVPVSVRREFLSDVHRGLRAHILCHLEDSGKQEV